MSVHSVIQCLFSRQIYSSISCCSSDHASRVSNRFYDMSTVGGYRVTISTQWDRYIQCNSCSVVCVGTLVIALFSHHFNTYNFPTQIIGNSHVFWRGNEARTTFPFISTSLFGFLCVWLMARRWHFATIETIMKNSRLTTCRVLIKLKPLSWTIATTGRKAALPPDRKCPASRLHSIRFLIWRD